MADRTETVRDFTIAFDERRALLRLGHRKQPLAADNPIRRVVNEEARRALTLVDPAAAYAILDAAETTEHPVFRQAVKAALAVCTIGPRLEAEAAACFESNDMLRGLILDALGSDAVAQVSKTMEILLVHAALDMGLWPSKRFSPGYRGWDVSEQAFIFSRVPVQDIGVRLTEGFMMVPRKSYSFRINFYRDRNLTTRRF